MRKLTEYFIKRPVLFWSLVGAMVIGGIGAFMVMPKLEDPEVTVKQASVVVMWPDASAHEIELQVAQLVEDELRALPDVKKVKTECHNGSALFTVEFLMTVQMKDVEQHFDLLRRKVNDVASRLPQGCYAPVVIDDMLDVYGIFYAITGDGYDYHELYKYARYLRRELLSVKGVKRVNILGMRNEVINIILTKEQVARNGIMPTQIMMALQSVGQVVNAGKYRTDEDRISVYVDDCTQDVEGIKNLYIQTMDGKTLRIGDIARVERDYVKPQTSGLFVNSKPALGISVAIEKGSIVPDVGHATDAKLAEAMKSVPAGITHTKIFFQPDKVDSAISSFMVNLLESVLIVIIALIFAMGFRSGLIIGIGLVLTVGLSFPILLTMGTTLHRISLGAFIVAMGMLVDNAVVIMDGILVDKGKGLGPKTYLYRVGQNTAWPLLGATIIAASTFLCVYLSPDSAGEYAGDLFLVLCVSLMVSWFLAMVQVPFFTKILFPPLKYHSKGSTDENGLPNTKMHRFVRKAISTLIEYKKTTVIVALVVLGVCIFGLTKAKNIFFPDFDYNQFVVECFFPSATDADTVRTKMLQMSDFVLKDPDVQQVCMSQGAAPCLYCLVRPMTSGGDCYGELIVTCKDYKGVCKNIPMLRQQLRQDYPEAYIRLRKYNFSTSTSHTIEVEFAGPDPAVLRNLTAQAEDIMRKCKYIDPYSVQCNWKPKGKALVTRYNQQDALRAGIGRSDVANALLAANDGMPVGVLTDQDRMVTLNLQVRNADGSRIQNIKDIPVWSTMNIHVSEDEMKGMMTGGVTMSDLQDKMFRSTPLRNVTNDVTLDWDEDLIYRLNGQRVMEAEADPAFDNPKATSKLAMATIQKDIDAIQLPQGYSYRWVGDGELTDEAIGNVMKNVPVTIIIILVVLLLLFNSWKKLLLIIMCLPFVICGISPALLGTGLPFTFMAIIGLIGLMGMMIKNAIVLVDEINRLQTEEHVEAYKAVIEATVSRVRPVLMASITTILGMFPLLWDPMYQSMAIVIMAGLAVGTIVTLILLPLFYTILFHIRKPLEA